MSAVVSGFSGNFGLPKALRLAVVAGVLALCGAGVQANEAIRVDMDQAKLVKLPEGTQTVVVGNPAIADVSVQKNSVMVITGRRPGRTNFIALDRSGSIISESQVNVGSSTAGRVVVRRGMEPSSYDCAPNCLPVAGVGDDEKSFTKVMSQSSALSREAREATALPPR